MNVLVTGGTGFTGSHLVQRLLEKGHHVRVLDNKLGLTSRQLRERGAEITQGSVCDPRLVDRLTNNCDIVYHLAAAFRELNVPKRHYWEVNVNGTRNVASAAMRHGIRKLVYCSTCGVHGNINTPPGDEDSRIAPEDYYQLTKYEGERVLQDYVDRGLDGVILRPAAIYGPGDPERFLILFRLVKRGRFMMCGSGKTFYHPLHVENLVDAFELAAEKGLPGHAYLIADERYWSLNDLVLRVADALSVKVHIRHVPFWPVWYASLACEVACAPLRLTPPIFRRRVNWFRQARAFSIDKARHELGYRPRVGIEQGLAETARWYRENKYV